MYTTKHATDRMRERSIAPIDARLVIRLGTRIRQGYVMQPSDVREAQGIHADPNDRIRKLGNLFVATEGEKVLTAYRMSPTQRLCALHSAGLQ